VKKKRLLLSSDFERGQAAVKLGVNAYTKSHRKPSAFRASGTSIKQKQAAKQGRRRRRIHIMRMKAAAAKKQWHWNAMATRESQTDDWKQQMLPAAAKANASIYLHFSPAEPCE
jgi:hypothetical protein